MSAVNVVDALKYGFELMAYLAVVYIVGFVIVFFGALLSGGGGMMSAGGSSGGIVLTIVGGLVALAGYLVILGGNIGIGYEVIADGVQKGVSERAS